MTDAPNAAQIAYWNAATGETWAELQERLDLAHVGVAGDDVQVHLQRRLLAEAVPAHGARERLLAGVRAHVSLQRPDFTSCIRALAAFERLYTSVSTHVLLQTAGISR